MFVLSGVLVGILIFIAMQFKYRIDDIEREKKLQEFMKSLDDKAKRAGTHKVSWVDFSEENKKKRKKK